MRFKHEFFFPFRCGQIQTFTPQIQVQMCGSDLDPLKKQTLKRLKLVVKRCWVMWHTWGPNEEQELRFCKKSKTGLTGSGNNFQNLLLMYHLIWFTFSICATSIYGTSYLKGGFPIIARFVGLYGVYVSQVVHANTKKKKKGNMQIPICTLIVLTTCNKKVRHHGIASGVEPTHVTIAFNFWFSILCLLKEPKNHHPSMSLNTHPYHL